MMQTDTLSKILSWVGPKTVGEGFSSLIGKPYAEVLILTTISPLKLVYHSHIVDFLTGFTECTPTMGTQYGNL